MNYILKCLKQYADFNGRARRREYWIFFITYMIIYYLLYYVFDLLLLSSLFALLFFIPLLAVSVRRMHDIGKSGWWFLVQIIPFVGNIIFIALSLMDSKMGPNRYGANPKEEPGL